ncbi:MAG: hypothetical protein ACKO8G_00365 [Actinomycetota bacterium]
MRRLTALSLTILALAALGPSVAATADTTASRAVQVQGVVRLWHGDELPAPTQEGVLLDTGNRTIPLALPLAQAAAFAGATVRATGVYQAETLVPTRPLEVVAAAGGTTSSGTTSTALVAGTAVKQVAVILINFSNNASQPWTPAAAENVVLDANLDNPNSIRAHYEETSDGAITLAGGVFGWYTIAATDANCAYGTWASQARTAAYSDALAAGLDLNSTSVYKVYAFPNTSCTWAGLGELPGDESWTDGYMDLRVIAHELGHNFGVHHAASLACSATSGRVPVTAREADDCSYSEYGDPYDIMGASSWKTRHAWFRSQLGYPMATTVVTPTTTMDQTYSLTQLEPESDLAAVRLLRIARGTSTPSYLDVEFRGAKAPFDNFSATDPMVTGVTVRIGWSNAYRAQSKLLDATSTATFADAAIQPGQSLWDPVAGVRITLVSVNAGVATVRVQGEPDTAAPSAVSGLGAVTDTTPRNVLTWGASTDDHAVAGYEVKRNGTRCAIVRTTSATDTGAWTSCPGLTGGALYTYTVTPYDTAGKFGAPTSVDIVAGSPDTTPPTDPGTPVQTGATASSVSISWTGSTDEVGIGGYQVLRDGVVVATTTGTGTTWTDTSAGLAPGTSYTYSVKARDLSYNWSAESAGGSAATANAPLAPDKVSISAVLGRVTVSWSAGTDALAYEVVREFYDKRKGWVSTTLTTSTTSLSLTDTVNKAGRYRYRVRSKSGTVVSTYTYSAEVSVTLR